MELDVFRNEVDASADRQYRNAVRRLKFCAILAVLCFVLAVSVYAVGGGLVTACVLALIGCEFCREVKDWGDEAIAVNKWRDSMLYKIDRMEGEDD